MKKNDRRHNNPGRPRKPGNSRKKSAIGIKMTDAELARIRANAAAAQLTITDWVVQRCC